MFRYYCNITHVRRPDDTICFRNFDRRHDSVKKILHENFFPVRNSMLKIIITALNKPLKTQKESLKTFSVNIQYCVRVLILTL